jgi:hypothetical protein
MMKYHERSDTQGFLVSLAIVTLIAAVLVIV